MALAYAVRRRAAPRGYRAHVVDLTTDATYAAGGYTLDPAAVGMGRIDGVQDLGGTVGFIGRFHPTTGKLLFFKTGSATSTALLECAGNEATLNGAIFRLLIVGDFSN